METRALFYELEYPYKYKDSIFGSYYIIAMDPCIRLYVIRDHPFQHSLDSPDFDSNAPYEPVNQAAPEPDLVDAYVPEFDPADAYVLAIPLEWDLLMEPLIPPSLAA
ncbi:hypothetical protein AHAS_Ahas20G0129900 [Arachis hypogaea]